MNEQELQVVAQALNDILEVNNSIRKKGEEKLNQMKQFDADKYAGYLTTVISSSIYTQEVRSLASVILRRNISNTDSDSQDASNQSNNSNLWLRMNSNAKEFVKNELLKTISESKEKPLVHKICNLLIEIGGTMFEQEEQVWQELLRIIFDFVNSDVDLKVDAGLQIFNGLFSYLMDHLVKYKNDLYGIFDKTLQHQSLDINLAALQAVSNFLQIAERKDSLQFIQLLPLMANVAVKALQMDDETVLQDALVEFNELAEIEPKFFSQNFKDLFNLFSPIVFKNDYTNPIIRHQPIEFFVSLQERSPKTLKNDQTTLKNILDMIFKLMIDIDEEIDSKWLKPKEGFRLEEDEEDEDSVAFGKVCVDRLVSSVGEEIMLPLLSQLVQNTLANDEDWRYKNAGLMALSQIGEYIQNVSSIAQMMATVLQHLQHPNPRIRFAALHCIGQMSEDMKEEFQDRFHEQVMPALLQCLDDPIPRVQSHACACLNNFLEGIKHEVAVGYLNPLVEKLCSLIQNGISVIKENAVTALSSLAEATQDEFEPYFDQTMEFLSIYLGQYNEPIYKQFKGQLIEALSIIASSVSMDKFRPHSQSLIHAMLEIQTKQLDSRDPQRNYLITAWKRLCSQMYEEFIPYLELILPSLFTMAEHNPEMSIQGSNHKGSLIDVLSEVNADAALDKKHQHDVHTDETEEKNEAIQTLSTFIEELGSKYFPWAEPTAQIFFSLVCYEANNGIRQSVANALPGLINCIKEGSQDLQLLVNVSRQSLENLGKVIVLENDTYTMNCQVYAMKDILAEVEQQFLDQEAVDMLSNLIVDQYTKSNERIKDNNSKAKLDDFDQDEEDLEVIKEENKNEQELQMSFVELIGMLLKYHNQFCGNLFNMLYNQIIPEALSSNEKFKNKLALYLLDDMVEHLGSQMLGSNYPTVAQELMKYTQSPHASLRQAATYGVGMMAFKNGEAFTPFVNEALQGLKVAIEYQMSRDVSQKNDKVKQFNFAKDNAIGALGKIICYQSQAVDQATMIPNWIGLLPLKQDLEESKTQNGILADLIIQVPQFVFGSQYERFEIVILILSEILQQKYLKPDDYDKFAQFLQASSVDQNLGPMFQNICQNRLTQDGQERFQHALQQRY
eukprot:403368238